MTKKIHIIGAGIGGLTTALALKQQGLDVHIFEGAAEIKPVGAGIIIANNAMQVFQKLGIHGTIERAGNRISCMKITDEKLKPISVTDLTVYEKKYGVHNIAIHRGVLQQILASELGYEHISLSKRLLKIEHTEGFRLAFEDGSTLQSDFLIGADGIKSVVRNQLFEKSMLRNAHQICWRGVCDMDVAQKYSNELNEAWGRGSRFGFVKIGDKKVYWYALTKATGIKAEDVILTDIFKKFNSDILRIIENTSKEQIIVGDIVDLKPIRTWQQKNVCLVGDAAHATTPNLGQGACQAVEDAYVLGCLVNRGVPFEKILGEYEHLRRKKAHTVVNMSWTIGKMAHIENSFGVWLRNFAMKSFSSLAGNRQLDMIFNLDY